MNSSCSTQRLAALIGSACQWAKPWARNLSAPWERAKAQSAPKAGAWQVINYREENLVERLKEITGGKKVRVVYDSVGRDTWNGRWIACNAAA